MLLKDSPGVDPSITRTEEARFQRDGSMPSRKGLVVPTSTVGALYLLTVEREYSKLEWSSSPTRMRAAAFSMSRLIRPDDDLIISHTPALILLLLNIRTKHAC